MHTDTFVDPSGPAGWLPFLGLIGLAAVVVVILGCLIVIASPKRMRFSTSDRVTAAILAFVLAGITWSLWQLPKPLG